MPFDPIVGPVGVAYNRREETKMNVGQRLGRFALAAAALMLAATTVLGQATDQPTARRIAVLAAIEGPIGPATMRHVEKVIATAAERNAEVVILRIYTPGGLVDSMREIITEILGSTIPVIGYVAPPGAHAASAGTYILYATHVAAMAPGTNLGAATPVQIGGLPGTPSPGDDQPAGDKPAGDGPGPSEGTGDEAGEDEIAGEPKIGVRIRSLAPGDAMNAKATNDAVAFIRSLAEMHGRNADWAEKAVREAASLSSAQALEQGVIDLMADDIDALLAAIDGRTVPIGGSERVLSTRGLAVERLEPDSITRLLGVLSNPNVALMLMMLGVYGIIFEFMNPGSVVPGVVGAICLTLGLYALNQLPLDYAGLALVGLGVAFMVAEAFTPTFGILGFGGLVAFVIGAAMLVDTDVPAYQVSWWVIGVMAVLSGAVLTLLLGFTVRAYRRPVAGGVAQLVGTEARVLDWSGGGGHVWAEGERWQASAERNLAVGDPVRVRRIEGLTLVGDPTTVVDSINLQDRRKGD
jgi:membrane-bound serine protease (ClpP class)